MRLNVVFLSCIISLGAASGFAQDAAPLPAITVAQVEAKTLRQRVIVSGLIAPVEMVQVAPLVEGQPIEQLLVDIGDVVQEGQVLAVLSKTTLTLQKAQFEASLAAAKAAVAQAEAQMLETQSTAEEAQRVSARTQNLSKQGSASRAAADAAQAQAVSAQARLAVATQSSEAARAQRALAEAQLANVTLQLDRTEVKAPVSGEITARNARIGAVASAAGQPMFSIIRDSALEVRADVSETDLLQLQLGQPAYLRVAGALAPLNGTLRLIEPTIDERTRLGHARIAIEPGQRVIAGMYVEAEIIAAERSGLAVPITALGADSGGDFVMKVTEGIAQKHYVTTGIRDGGLVEVLTGLTAQDTVVTKAGAFVRDGDHINPILAQQ